ncbi:hypothetical protein AAU61_06660 [Desulfocarbo indianensis]|nr:hypothetical protein AAU61_06660 [Desulfocarbo indianensis]
MQKVMTYKSGNFLFSRKYDADSLRDSLLEARVLQEAVADLPILPSLAARLEEEVVSKAVFATAAIEGNPLTEEEVSLIEADPDLVKQQGNAQKEIANLKRTYGILKEIESSGEYLDINEELVKSIHKTVTQNIDHAYNEPGAFRNHKVQVGDKNHGGIYTPPKTLVDIQNLMRHFCDWINSGKLREQNTIIRAALAHYHLGIIHPFADGNGRTARFLEALILHTGGLKYVSVMLANYYYKHVDDYYWAFSGSLRNKDGDLTPFLQCVLAGYVEALRELKTKIADLVRRFVIREFLISRKNEKAITMRQYDLLSSLLDNPMAFSLNDLFEKVPFMFLYRDVSERTARRDIQRLLKGGFLVEAGNKKYALNTRMLG